MLYMIFIIKKYIYPNFKEEDVSNEIYIDKIKELLKNFFSRI